MCFNFGNKNKIVIEAIVKQVQKMPYIAPDLAYEASENTAESILTVLPEGLDKIFFSTSGTEANETAVKILRQYTVPNYKIIFRYHSYHGSTATSISLTGDPRR